jgi:26S proteasome regulatory subunit N7
MSQEVKKILDEDAPDEEGTQDVILKVAGHLHKLSLSDRDCPPALKSETKTLLLADITEHNMAPYYEYVCSTLSWEVDQTLLTTMQDANTAELKRLDEKQADAKENLGDTEVREVQLARADLYARIGEKARAYAAYKELFDVVVGIGARIDVIFSILRLSLTWNDMAVLKENIVKARALVEEGGDWERRNRLGVYDATYHMITRQFKPAAELLLNSTATFTCTELFDYNQFVFYTAIVSMFALDRVTIREKLARNPEILAVIDEIPNIRPFVFSLLQCQYKEFFQNTVALGPAIMQDRYFSPHLGFIVRELRVVGYSQFLTSYQSVTLASMANAFGLSVEFLDREVSRFIAAGRLNCKIDKVGGFIETVRPDAKNAQYLAMIKSGDALLSKVQKLNKVAHFV